MSHPTRRHTLLGAAAVLAASPVIAQTPGVQTQGGQTPGAQSPGALTSAALTRVTLQSAVGDIVIELAIDKAPITAANFLRYVDAHRYDGAAFYRALKLASAPITGLIQGGVSNDPAKAFPPIAHESTQATGLSHTDGAISMARFDPGTATSEFFICVGNLAALDANPGDPGYAVFGHVAGGMDVVRKILDLPVSTTGDGVMKGQMLASPLAITGARRG